MTADPIALGDDPLAALDPDARATFSALAGHLIPEAHGHGNERWATLALVTGFVLMLVLDNALV